MGSSPTWGTKFFRFATLTIGFLGLAIGALLLGVAGGGLNGFGDPSGMGMVSLGLLLFGTPISAGMLAIGFLGSLLFKK